ncbi:tripartite tricarboxylate transporter TctB family protein [Xanthobacteraceae bacterium Astr-EGSB]|uniref:tripartite tricarboxylate transporter TctB family protein n=1 Tax=Astrobacterium formosum TaxID=3069710 RepID=UPI0027AFC682|nr:tripartite tricarboxylate transporter TctB family protein [Xanthobacteraceae bacterium Astr-EGSB]
MRANDAICGLVLLVLAAVMAALTIPFPEFPGQNYGPDLLPRILSVALAICGALLIKRGWQARGQGDPWFTRPAWLGVPIKVMRLLLVIAALLFYIFAGDPLGFLPVSFIIIAVLAIAFGGRPFWALVAALVATLAINYFFGSIMRVPLPRGILDLFV